MIYMFCYKCQKKKIILKLTDNRIMFIEFLNQRCRELILLKLHKKAHLQLTCRLNLQNPLRCMVPKYNEEYEILFHLKLKHFPVELKKKKKCI